MTGDEPRRGPGRPSIGGKAHIAFGDRLALLDEWAARHGVAKRADAAREAVDVLVARDRLLAAWSAAADGLPADSPAAEVLRRCVGELLAAGNLPGLVTAGEYVTDLAAPAADAPPSRTGMRTGRARRLSAD
ncbi:hypothetical protein [Amycolatopsis sp. CA-128772]|uniref:hypothetical protein n=1 Tax=Amycolatopsis sp. CA-128772 TaxID=2073159 RepID=UPI000CD199E5|nr:hypothetical protein [Amycolatopsis sp. CA-128772]